MRVRRCVNCGKWFNPTRSIQPGCSHECEMEIAIAHAEGSLESRVKQEAIDASKAKREFVSNDRDHQLKLTQTVFNAWVRFRDKGEPCNSCGRSTGCKMNAGHFLSVASHPSLRFNALNAHLQCEHCNRYKNGNMGGYKPRLIEKIGLDKVEWLEGPHDKVKYTCDQLREIRAYYAKLTRAKNKNDSDCPHVERFHNDV